MQKRDKLVIFLAGVLTILFVYKIYVNISKEIFSGDREISSSRVKVGEVLMRLKEAGLKPHEAKYYKVIR